MKKPFNTLRVSITGVLADIQRQALYHPRRFDRQRNYRDSFTIYQKVITTLMLFGSITMCFIKSFMYQRGAMWFILTPLFLKKS